MPVNMQMMAQRRPMMPQRARLTEFVAEDWSRKLSLSEKEANGREQTRTAGGMDDGLRRVKGSFCAFDLTAD